MHCRSARRVVWSTAILTLTSLTAAEAQRLKARLEHDGRAVELECGATRYGSHSLDELQPGTEWRLGSNTASTLLVETPLVSGETVVPTGSYRVKLRRDGDLQFELTIEGAGYELEGGDALYVGGAYAEHEKAAEKLDVRFVDREPAQDEDDALRAGSLEIRFGPHSVTIPAALAPTASVKASGFRVDSFGIPARVLEARRDRGVPTVVAAVRKKGRPPKGAPDAYNLLVSDDEAILLPAQVAPASSYGFAPVVPPADEWTFRGTVEWADAQEEAPRSEVTKVEVTKEKRLRFTLRCGAKEGVVEIDAPVRPRRGAG